MKTFICVEIQDDSMAGNRYVEIGTITAETKEKALLKYVAWKQEEWDRIFGVRAWYAEAVESIERKDYKKVTMEPEDAISFGVGDGEVIIKEQTIAL